jgi:hypothetical protein
VRARERWREEFTQKEKKKLTDREKGERERGREGEEGEEKNHLTAIWNGTMTIAPLHFRSLFD